MATDHILVVEDEPITRAQLVCHFEEAGYTVTALPSGQQLLDTVVGSDISLVLLDIRMPGEDGLTLTRELRAKSDVGIILVTGQQERVDRIVGLESGADDYVTKPFGVDELMARVRAALRHRVAADGKPPIFRTGEMVVDLLHRVVTVGGSEVKLSPKEYDILREMVTHAGKVLTHRHLLRAAWGAEDAVDVQYLRVYMRQLRQKIEKRPELPAYIVTEPGVGYRLQVID